MSNQFFNLNADRLADGRIRLKQEDSGEDSVIDAHPEQIKFIARQLCGMNSDAEYTVAELERRLAVLTDKIQNIVCDGGFRRCILNRCDDGSLWLARLDAALDLALELDGGRLEPEYRETDDDHPAPRAVAAGSDNAVTDKETHQQPKKPAPYAAEAGQHALPI